VLTNGSCGKLQSRGTAELRSSYSSGTRFALSLGDKPGSSMAHAVTVTALRRELKGYKPFFRTLVTSACTRLGCGTVDSACNLGSLCRASSPEEVPCEYNSTGTGGQCRCLYRPPVSWGEAYISGSTLCREISQEIKQKIDVARHT